VEVITGTHPQAISALAAKRMGVFKPIPDYRLTRRDKKHRFMLKLEQWFGFRFNKYTTSWCADFWRDGYEIQTWRH